MKSKLFTLAFFGAFFLSSFDKKTAENAFIIQNKVYPLNCSLIANESYGIKSKFEVDLISEHNDVAKAKTYIWLSLASNNTSSLSNGVYQFSSIGLNQRLPFQFNGSVRVNNHVLEVVEGTASISNNCGDLDIQFILKLQNGDIAQGTFRGKASQVDRSRI